MIFADNGLTAVQLGLYAVAVLGQRLDKPAAFASLDEFGPTHNTLPRTSSAISPWISDSISQGCRDRVLLSNKDPTKFKAYSVYMGDCEMPWHFCQEDGASPSIEKFVDTFARLPIGMRQFVGDVVHFKDGTPGTAWKSQIVQVGGASGNFVGVFEHESSHCIDGANGIGMRSGDQTWRDAYNRDTHVVDTYAQNNHEENYAQYLGMVLYDRFTNGRLQTYPQYWQINNQIWRMADAADTTQPWGDHILDYSGNKKCGRRWEHTPAVNPKTGALSGCEFYVSGNSGIKIISSRSMTRDTTENAPPTNCSLGHIH